MAKPILGMKYPHHRLQHVQGAPYYVKIKIGTAVEVPSIVHLGLNFIKTGTSLTAVGLDRRPRYSWKHFQNRITMLSAKVEPCDKNNVICIRIEKGDASSSHGDSGAPLIEDGHAVGRPRGSRKLNITAAYLRANQQKI